MSMPHTLFVKLYVTFIALLICWPRTAEAQESDPPADSAQADASTDQEYILKTYEIGDLIINVQDHPYSDSRQSVPKSLGGGGGGGGVFSVPDNANILRTHDHLTTTGTAPRIVLCQFGGGGGSGGGMGGGRDSGSSNLAPANATVTMDDVKRVLVSTVASDTWSDNGGGGQIEPLGTALIVRQTPAVHQQIEELLKQIRDGSGHRKTVTIDARWLLINSDELDSLIISDQDGVPQVDRKVLADFTRRPQSVRGVINCFSGQLVYLVSGTRRNVVSGYIPVVGDLEKDGAERLVLTGSVPRIQLVSDTQAVSGATQPRVGYQPITENPNFGTLLEIRPTLMRGDDTAVVDLKSMLTAPGEQPAEPVAAAAPIAPAVDRIAIDIQEFATTLRMPLGKPVLVGGLTYLAGSMRSNENGTSTESPQLYLVLEVR